MNKFVIQIEVEIKWILYIRIEQNCGKQNGHGNENNKKKLEILNWSKFENVSNDWVDNSQSKIQLIHFITR